MPCSPSDVSFAVPEGPTGPAIPGFGVPFSLNLPNLNPFPPGFPEDLLNLFNLLEMLIPPGGLKPQLNLNFGKDIFDAIIKLLDQFMPFLMLYKFFLPILNLIICIIEVLCALTNPFKLIAALNRLFTVCIPEFLNLFPIFALIIMIISLLLLILALIEYLIAQILALILLILRNINALVLAFQQSDASGVLAIANKLGALLCLFQNLFVLFAIFNIIIEIIKDILSKLFAIPPCEDGGSGNDNSCCTPDVCPSIVQNVYTNTTGTLKYFPQIGQSVPGLPIFPGLPAFGFNIRNEEWQLYDIQQTQGQAFSNIYNAFDVTTFPKPVFFPTDATYTATTAPSQAPYQINLTVFYNPILWNGRLGTPRYIQFKNCIFQFSPTPNLLEGDLSTQGVSQGVAQIVGGLGYEADGTTVLNGFAPDGITPLVDSSGNPVQATLENFLHMPAVNANPAPTPSINDGYTFLDVTYTFIPNIAPLLQKSIVTLGCIPNVSLNREFINNVFAGDAGVQGAQLQALVNSPNFPNPAAAQACMTNAITALRSNLTVAGVADFQTTCLTCLAKLQSDTQNALGNLIALGADPCNSSFTLSPSLQFTNTAITVSVNINERNSLPLTNNLPPSVAASVASELKGYPTFGNIGPFTYDGYQLFNAELTSPVPGVGSIMISFNNQMLCTNTIPTDGTAPTHTLQNLSYQFIQSGTGTITGEGDTTGEPRRDAGDLSRDGTGSE